MKNFETSTAYPTTLPVVASVWVRTGRIAPLTVPSSGVLQGTRVSTGRTRTSVVAPTALLPITDAAMTVGGGSGIRSWKPPV